MKIGIDAKWLFRGQISGRVFIQNVLPELLNLHPEIEWHIFLDKKDKDRAVPFVSQNANVHYVWGRFNMLSNLFVIPSYAKQLNLDAVLFQTFCPKGKTFSSIAFIHDILFKNYPQYFTWKERLYFKPLKWTTRYADRIITTTEFVRRELQEFKYSRPGQQVAIVPLGVKNIFKPCKEQDPTFLTRVKEKYRLPDHYILLVGRLNARKNIQSMIRALPSVNDNVIRVVIAGDRSWKKPPIEHLLATKSAKDRVVFTGPVSDDELAALYAMARIFCFPSFAEGFGLPPLEAMASGVPVVVSNTTAMPEVCGTASLFADPHDPNNIAQKVNELLHNERLYMEKVSEGLERARQYTWRSTAEGIMKVILSAVEKEVK